MGKKQFLAKFKRFQKRYALSEQTFLKVTFNS